MALSSKKRSKLQEQRAARDLDGRQIGNNKHRGGGDFESPSHEYGEAKYTDRPTYTLTRATVEKLWKQAVPRGKTPVLQLEFQGQPSAGRYGILFRTEVPEGCKAPYVAAASVALPRGGVAHWLLKGRVFIKFVAGIKPEVILEIMHWNDAVDELKGLREERSGGIP